MASPRGGFSPRWLLPAVASPRGGFSVVEHGLYGVTASVVAVCRLSSCGSRAPEHRLSSCGAWAELLHGMWDLPRSDTELVSPALAGGFFTPEPPEMLHRLFFISLVVEELFCQSSGFFHQ